jgi:hypothetical protein
MKTLHKTKSHTNNDAYVARSFVKLKYYPIIIIMAHNEFDPCNHASFFHKGNPRELVK